MKAVIARERSSTTYGCSIPTSVQKKMLHKHHCSSLREAVQLSLRHESVMERGRFGQPATGKNRRVNQAVIAGGGASRRKSRH
jgi:hypothetical protein